MSYRTYVTDAMYLYGMGKGFSKRWIEIITPEDPEESEADTRTGDEIALYVIKNAGLSFQERSETE